jgi:hypothetical protein
VGLELQLAAQPAAAGEIRFAADAMLGRLARWLRLIGYDTTFDAHVTDAQLARLALQDGRAVLTRDRALPLEWSLPQVLVLRDEPLADQLRLVVEHFQLDWRSRRFTRCSRCNVPLVASGALSRCPRCERIYWAGSHVERMTRALEAALGPTGGSQ